MSGLEGGFFGEKITKDVAKKVDVKEGLLLHISHASLDYTSDAKPVTLYVDTGAGKKYVICTLKDCGHTPLDLNFSSPVTLSVKGNGNSAVHVSGYWEFMADPEMDFEEDEEDEEIEEPKQVEAKKEAKSPKKSPKSAPAAAAKAVEAEAEIEDDDDSITPSMLAAMMEEGEEFEEFEEIEEEEEPEAPPAPVVGKKRPAAQVQAPAAAKKQKGNDGKAKQTPPPQPPQQQQKKGGKKGKKN